MRTSRRRVVVLVAAALALMGGGSVGRVGAAEPAAPVATFELSAMSDGQFDMAGWSGVVNEGGTRCRKALVAKAGEARVKAWWKAGDLRPAEGDRFVLDVKYKDVLAKPAQFHIFSGIARNFGYWPLHKFGGANDGQWKTAAIPLPWDMVARLVSSLDPARNAPELTAFEISAPADLPVASVTVRKDAPGDEARFYAECRTQIAAEQSAAREKNPPPVVKAPPKATGPLAVFPWDPGCRLFQDCGGLPGTLGKPVKVRMCLNELEPGSFGVYANGAGLTGVDYEITPLTDASGKILKAVVERRTAEYALLDGKWTPMRFWPAYAVDIQAGRSHWFFFNIETRRGESAPGLYKGTIAIKAKEGKVELPLEVEVLPVDLQTMDEAGIAMFGCYSRMPPMHDLEFERRYNYGGALLWYASFAPPMALKDGKLVFDFTYPDDWMKGARRRGFTGAIWYLGGNSAKMPNTLTLFSKLGTMDKKMTYEQWCTAQNGKNLLPETRSRFVEWMRTLNEHAVSNGWLELFPTPHDEPQKWASRGAWIKSFFKDACAAIREADPRIRVYGCIHHVRNWQGIVELWNVFVDDIDVYNTNAVGEDLDVANKVRKAGAAAKARGGKDKLFWQYTALGGGMPESQRFSFGFFYGSFGSSGCTAWAYNWDDSWDISGRKGDLAVTAWTTPYQTIPSPWMEGQREGLDDRRVIATYQKRFAKDPAALKVLDKILDEARASRSKKSGENKEAGFFDAIDNASKLTQWRNTLLEKLAAAK